MTLSKKQKAKSKKQKAKSKKQKQELENQHDRTLDDRVRERIKVVRVHP